MAPPTNHDGPVHGRVAAADDNRWVVVIGPSGRIAATEPDAWLVAAGEHKHQALTLDTTMPRVRLGAGALTDRRGQVPVLLGCPVSQSYCEGKVELDVAARGANRVLVLGRTNYHIPGGKHARVLVRLATGTLAKLGRTRSVRVTIAAVARNTRGLVGSSRRLTVLHLPALHSGTR